MLSAVIAMYWRSLIWSVPAEDLMVLCHWFDFSLGITTIILLIIFSTLTQYLCVPIPQAVLFSFFYQKVNMGFLACAMVFELAAHMKVRPALIGEPARAYSKELRQILHHVSARGGTLNIYFHWT